VFLIPFLASLTIPISFNAFAGLATEIPAKHLARLFRAALVIKERGELQGNGWSIILGKGGMSI
jgi:hypothetical protein